MNKYLLFAAAAMIPFPTLSFVPVRTFLTGYRCHRTGSIALTENQKRSKLFFFGNKVGSYFTGGVKANLQDNCGVGGDGLTLHPEGEHKASVIFLHGLGDTASGWMPVMYQIAAVYKVDHVKFILPTAKTRPISLNMGMPMPGWFDIFDLGEDAPEDRAGIEDSAKRIEAIVQSEIEDAGIPKSKIIVGGFSQGGAVALRSYVKDFEQSKADGTDSLGGCIACSTWLPLREDYKAGSPSSTASNKKNEHGILQCHGVEDEVVRMQWGKLSKEKMVNELGLTVDWREFAGMGHSACEEEIDDIAAYIKKFVE